MLQIFYDRFYGGLAWTLFHQGKFPKVITLRKWRKWLTILIRFFDAQLTLLYHVEGVAFLSFAYHPFIGVEMSLLKGIADLYPFVGLHLL